MSILTSSIGSSMLVLSAHGSLTYENTLEGLIFLDRLESEQKSCLYDPTPQGLFRPHSLGGTSNPLGMTKIFGT